GAPVTVVFRRDGALHTAQIKGRGYNWSVYGLEGPRVDKDGRPIQLLGIGYLSTPDLVDVGVIGSLKHALVYPVEQSKFIGAALWGIVKDPSTADPGGPKRIMETM